MGFVGVTHAFVEYWEYMDTIRLAADPTCSAKLQQAVLAIDAILTSGKPYLIHALKGLFGVAELKHGEDFASLITVRLNLLIVVHLTRFDSFQWNTMIAPPGCLASEELG